MTPDTIPLDLAAFVERHKHRHPSNTKALAEIEAAVDAFMAVSAGEHLQAAEEAERRGLTNAAVRCRQWAMRRMQADSVGKTAILTDYWAAFLGAGGDALKAA